MRSPVYPSLYQINTRVWLNELGCRLRRSVTLDAVPEAELDQLAEIGVDWIWLLSVWQTGKTGRDQSRKNPAWRKEFQETLPDLRDEDIIGSGFAISSYAVHESLGGDPALAKFRERLRKRGLRLMLDFVPNHTALDHPWVEQHPENYIAASELDAARAPMNYAWITSRGGKRLLAHGRDPYFPGWVDTLQLNYGNRDTREAMSGELQRIARQCDGVRCDMAMLVLPEIFQRTWGIPAEPFWPDAIRKVKAVAPDFCFMAEVYWDLEWTMQQQGFDYAYDKRLYDRLREGHGRAVREHFRAGLDYQDGLARFLENHDEPRAAATFPAGMHQAAAVVTYLAPGLRFFHQGQFDGRLQRIPGHLGRAPQEEVHPALRQFYERLLKVLTLEVVRAGQWRLLECEPAWDGNGSCDSLLAYSWQHAEARLLVTVNYAHHPSQGYVRLPFQDLGNSRWRLRDLMSEAVYERNGPALVASGLYLEVEPWKCHVFEMKPI